ncbi:MAG: discoidin domain-containing protein [Polyangiaceae bacterium]|nr:discoidin domain-containing protein [Polyangiaceae bacterium]
MRQKLAAAQEEAFGGSAARRAAFEEATATREAAEVLLVHTPGAREAACSLLRDGLFSAARAVLPDPPQTPAEAWAGLSLPGAGRLDPFTDAERASLERAFVGTGDEQTPSDSEARLAVLRLGLDVVLASARGEVRKVARVRLARAMRWTVAVLVPLAIVAAVVWLQHVRWKKSDLALNKPATASSYYGKYTDASGAVDGDLWGIGFHTNNDDHPWLRVDLGAVHKIRQVIAYNADHCCFDRAVPLIVEVSTDGKVYKQVARRKRPFGEWRANFAPVDARYVKLTVDRVSMLHLSEVEVR